MKNETIDNNVKVLQDAILEANRFQTKALEAINRLNVIKFDRCGNMSTKEFGAVKRSAIDLGRVCSIVNQLKTY